ncbi:MAG: hypothetical protein FWC27_13405 [Firmicutes bacterium]|nr:hypothetical protein [Bacillota bacterium]
MLGILGLGFLFVALVTGSTFAWFTAFDSKDNKMDTPQFGDVSIAEVFLEPKSWIPGQEITKEVGVKNMGELDALVRIAFEELLDKYTGPSQAGAAPLSAGQTPVLFDSAKYTSANGWLPPASLGLTVDPALTTALQGATLMVRKMEITTAAPAGEDPSNGYGFVIWYPIPSGTYAGQAQAAYADLYLDGTVIKYAGAPVFYSYPARAVISIAWANLADPQLSPAAPVASPAPTAAQSAYSALDPDLLFGYDQIAATPTPGKWFYNQDDGYFYFIGKVEPNKVSPKLLSSVTMSTAADSSHVELKYSLLVNSEAIQNYETAMTSANGWGMNPGAPNTAAIIAGMIAANAFAPI